MIVKDMHQLRKHGIMPKGIKKGTPLAKEIEIRREAMIRSILGGSEKIIKQQIKVASLPVDEEGKNNDVIIKASNSLLDRAFGKPKESIDFTGNVQFSLKDLAQQRLQVKSTDITPLEDMI